MTFLLLSSKPDIYLEQGVDNQDVEHILQGDDNAVKNRLQFWNPVDGFQRPRERDIVAVPAVVTGITSTLSAALWPSASDQWKFC